jgi:hypothetical protein
MGQDLPLEDMSIEEKIKTMEDIWDDLISHAESLPSPEWHRGVLENRDKALGEGHEQSIDWDVAKKALKQDI